MGAGVAFWSFLDLALQAVLLAAPRSRLLVEELLGDAPVELVQVHRLDARLDLVVLGLQLLDGLRAGRLLGLVRGEDNVTQPFEDRSRDD